MDTKKIIYTLILLASLFINQKTNAQCHIDDWNALKALYSGFYIQLNGWNQLGGGTPSANCDLATLEGVKLNPSGRVEELSLAGMYSSEGIPPELGDLALLKKLSIFAIDFGGEIPAEIGNLSLLEHLDLSENYLFGEIPAELGKLKNLKHLNLSTNLLTGRIPAELGDIFDSNSSFDYLNLSRNALIGCFNTNLNFICNKVVTVILKTPSWPFENNNFMATWDEFCDSGMGACDTNGSDKAKPYVETESADVYVDDPSYGVILKAPDDNCFRLKVKTDGSLGTEKVECPN